MNKGRVTIEICTQNDICLTNVKPTSKGFTVTVEANNARAILNIVRQKHARAKILRKEGAVFKLHKFNIQWTHLSHRKFFTSSLLIEFSIQLLQ